MEQVQLDLESIGHLFTKTLWKVADNSDKSAKEILHELAHDAQKPGSTLREKAALATQTVVARIDERGEKLSSKTEKCSNDATHSVINETKELGERMLFMARSRTNQA